ncbi:MAG: hypothetical protein R2851_08915 [Caldilineaceae bacterium]
MAESADAQPPCAGPWWRAPGSLCPYPGGRVAGRARRRRLERVIHAAVAEYAGPVADDAAPVTEG